ncbi:unnamed protein product, partial [Staurois parvus]
RRKVSIIPESNSKVPHETRQRYVNSFVEEFLKESASVQEAFDKALSEEKAIYERCGSKNMYLSIAVNSLKKLRDQHNNGRRIFHCAFFSTLLFWYCSTTISQEHGEIRLQMIKM